MYHYNEKEYKTAIVHDWFCNMGGGDKVAEKFLDLFSDSPIYTICYLDRSLTDKLKGTDIRSSFIQKLLNQKKDNHQKFLPLMPTAVESFELSDYDIVLSSSSCCAKGVVTTPNTIHICYCHTPMRYAWEFMDEYTNGMRKKKKILASLLLNYMKIWDYCSAQRVDYFIANSQNVANRIRKHYGRDSVVINPPIDTDYFCISDEVDNPEEYYLCVSRLVKYKKIDIAVEACNKLKKRLIVIGQGEQLDYLKKIAGPTVSILGRMSDESIRDYYRKCKGFLFPGEEDFGMTPLEVQACGKPVIAFGKGGALETVIENKTGIFFYEQSVECLCSAIEKFESMHFSKDECRRNAENYSSVQFLNKMNEYIQSTINNRNELLGRQD